MVMVALVDLIYVNKMKHDSAALLIQMVRYVILGIFQVIL